MFQETKESQTHNCCEKCSMPPGPYFDCKKYDCDCHTVPAEMDIKTAITKAIEGGYNTHGWVPGDFIGHDAECIIFLDPLFWQCLGKALGWGDESECPLACCGGICPINIPMWQSQWHRFISHLSGGGTIGSFFENIEE